MISTFPALKVVDICTYVKGGWHMYIWLCIEFSQTYIVLNVTLKISHKCNWQCIRTSWGWARPNLVCLSNCWNFLYIFLFWFLQLDAGRPYIWFSNFGRLYFHALADFNTDALKKWMVLIYLSTESLGLLNIVLLQNSFIFSQWCIFWRKISIFPGEQSHMTYEFQAKSWGYGIGIVILWQF